MKVFVCSMCGYLAIDGAAPEKCPVCGAPKKAFAEKENYVKTGKDVATTGESEKKHVPAISVTKSCGLLPGSGCVDVNVKVGEIPHPMLPEHFITKIDFYVDKNFVARVYLTPEKLNAAAGIHLKSGGGTLTVIEQCNIHGAWMNEAKI